MLKGFDALTADPATVCHMLKGCADVQVKVRLCVYADEVTDDWAPHCFFEFDPINVCSVMTGDINYRDYDVVEENTKLFMEMMSLYRGRSAQLKYPGLPRESVMLLSSWLSLCR